MGRGVQMADLLLCRCRLLEFCRRLAFWIPHKATHRALLCARAELDSGARPYRTVRRVRHPRTWTNAVLLARTTSWQSVDERTPRVFVLVNQPRPCADCASTPAANRSCAGVGLGRIRHGCGPR